MSVVTWPDVAAAPPAGHVVEHLVRRCCEVRRRAGTVLAVAKWLMKSEPDVFGYDDLERVKREGWDGVRNYQARNFMRAMRRGDRAIFYHSNAKPPGVAGIAKIVKGAEPDPTQFDPDSKYFDATSDRGDPRWDWVTVAPDRKLEFVSLDELKQMPELAECRLLARGNRLSVVPLTEDEFDAIVAAADAKRRHR